MQWRAVLFKQLLVVGIPTKLNHAAMSLVLEEKQYYLVRKRKLNPQSQPCQPVTFSHHFFDRLSLIISPQLLCLPVTHAQQQQFNHFCTSGQQLPVESFQLSFMFRLYMIELLTCQSCRVAAETQIKVTNVSCHCVRLSIRVLQFCTASVAFCCRYSKLVRI